MLDLLPQYILQQLLEEEQRQKERQARYGSVRPLIYTIFKGLRFVAIGNRIYWMELNQTFHDFLITYLGSCLDEKWCNSENKKPIEEMHPIIQWYIALRTYQKEQFVPERKIQSAVFSGPVAAILHLAYNLFLLRDSLLLQDRLIHRLKDKSQFQGAMYEAYVTANFLRAGFTIDLEDEKDLSRSHCEFIATDMETGGKFSIEAKSRHRPGFLGFKGSRQYHDKIKPSIRGLLYNALGKIASYDRIIFIDINVPPEETGTLESSWFDELASDVTNLESEGYTIPAYILFTNHPYHYVGDNEPEPKKDFLLTAINIPGFKLGGANKAGEIDPTILRLFNSIIRHDKIPDSFDQ